MGKKTLESICMEGQGHILTFHLIFFLVNMPRWGVLHSVNGIFFIVGKIAWARQLFRRIQEPMEVFQQHPNILQGPDAKKIIKNFNKLAKVLLEFEVLYHRGWLRQVRKLSFITRGKDIGYWDGPWRKITWKYHYQILLMHLFYIEYNNNFNKMNEFNTKKKHYPSKSKENPFAPNHIYWSPL